MTAGAKVIWQKRRNGIPLILAITVAKVARISKKADRDIFCTSE
jgi:hypothetical protein